MLLPHGSSASPNPTGFDMFQVFEQGNCELCGQNELEQQLVGKSVLESNLVA